MAIFPELNSERILFLKPVLIYFNRQNTARIQKGIVLYLLNDNVTKCKSKFNDMTYLMTDDRRESIVLLVGKYTHWDVIMPKLEQRPLSHL